MRVPWTHGNIERHAAYWGWCIRTALKYKDMYPDNFFLVRYEDLLVNPASVIGDICHHIGEPFEENVLSNKRDDDVVPLWEKEWKSKSKCVLDPTYAYKWKKEISKDFAAYIQEYIAEELIAMDYELVKKIENAPYIKRHVWGRRMSNVWFIVTKVVRTYIFPRRNSYIKKRVASNEHAE